MDPNQDPRDPQGGEWLVCNKDNCKKLFKSRTGLLSHQAAHHTDITKSKRCTIPGCTATFSIRGLDRHLEKAHSIWKCRGTKVCSQIVFRSEERFLAHRRAVHGSAPNQGDQAGYDSDMEELDGKEDSEFRKAAAAEVGLYIEGDEENGSNDKPSTKEDEELTAILTEFSDWTVKRAAQKASHNALSASKSANDSAGGRKSTSRVRKRATSKKEKPKATPKFSIATLTKGPLLCEDPDYEAEDRAYEIEQLLLEQSGAAPLPYSGNNDMRGPALTRRPGSGPIPTTSMPRNRGPRPVYHAPAPSQDFQVVDRFSYPPPDLPNSVARAKKLAAEKLEKEREDETTEL